MANKFGFDKVLANFERLKKDLPKVLANDGQRFFAESFKRSGFENNTFQKWPEVQRRTPGTRAYRSATRSSRTRAILVKSGRLRREVSNSVKQVSFPRTVFRASAPYAVYHNEGTGRLPQRQFMGRSRKLETGFEKKIRSALKNIWK